MRRGEPVWGLFAWAGDSMVSWTLGTICLLSACRKEVEQLCTHLPEEFFKEQRWHYFSPPAVAAAGQMWGSLWVSFSLSEVHVFRTAVHTEQGCEARKSLKQDQGPQPNSCNWLFTEVAYKQKITAEIHCVPGTLLSYIYIYFTHFIY